MKTMRQEIFSVGIWNGIKFTLRDLEAIVKSFSDLKDVIKIPLKLGHDDNQPLTDGLPAIGWVNDVELNKETEKIEAIFEIQSKPVIRAIEMSLYRTVSIELDVGVTYKEKRFPFVLTGVALLGAELPAVNNLNDLGKFDKSLFSRDKTLHFNFKQGDNQVDEKELKALKERLEKAEADIKLSKESTEAKDKEIEELNKQIAENAEAEKKRLFADKKTAIIESLETLVKANKILPAVREKFIADITEDNIEAKATAADMMFESSMGMDKVAFNKKEEGQAKDPDKETDLSADVQLHNFATKLRLEKPEMTYRSAFEFAIQAHPDLAAEWLDSDGYKSKAA